jgi:uncharacterized membrane protein YfcA
MTVLDWTALALFGLAAGAGITAIGPGGVLATVGLVLFTDLSPAEVAGTAIVTHVATGTLGSLAYLRSGQLRHLETRRAALVLAGAALVGTPLGALINFHTSGRAFSLFLAALVCVVAVVLWTRKPPPTELQHLQHPTAMLAGVGVGVSVISGMFGLGGPLLTVPILVALGSAVLPTLASAQVQSVVIAGVGTVVYLVTGAISFKLAVVVGVPELCGVLVGWRAAQKLPSELLRRIMIVALFGAAAIVGVYG